MVELKNEFKMKTNKCDNIVCNHTFLSLVSIYKWNRNLNAFQNTNKIENTMNFTILDSCLFLYHSFFV